MKNSYETPLQNKSSTNSLRYGSVNCVNPRYRSGSVNNNEYQRRIIPGSFSNGISIAPASPKYGISNNNIVRHEYIRQGNSEPPNFKELVSYYFPCFYWIPKYRSSTLIYDLLAGLTLASFQIPLALSYATSIAHVDPLCGLYTLALTPLIYTVLGSTSQMIVGPESAISLVIGQNIQEYKKHDENFDPILLVVVVSFIGGVILFISGLFRLGYLSNLFSKALLQGFVSSVGFVMIVDALINELKLGHLLAKSKDHIGTPFQKLVFICHNISDNYHAPTAVLSFLSLSILLICRFSKKKLIKTHKWPIFVPDILIVLMFTIFLSYWKDFPEKYDIDVLGDFKSQQRTLFQNPLSLKSRKLIPELIDTGLITAIFGFFETITTSKAMDSNSDSVTSSNRELVALGAQNIAASIFGSLPSVGGYGRSRINVISGGKTPMSGAFMGLITLLAIGYLMPLIHYTPVCMLSVITTLIGFTLIEEIPKVIKFHWKCRGYNELIVIVLTFLTAIFYSIETSIYIGCFYSILNIVKHSAGSRIRIVTYSHNNSIVRDIEGDQTLSMHEYSTLDEELNETIIINIPEPLTFTNCEDLKNRLNRFERLGAINAHPGKQAYRAPNKTKYVIFDFEGMTSIDSSATEILSGIISKYFRNNTFILFANVSSNSLIRYRLENSNITSNVYLNENKNRMTNDIEYEQDIFFPSVNDALLQVRILKSEQLDNQSIQNSFVSETLINSELV